MCVCVSLWRTFPLRTQVGDGYGGMQKNQFWGAVCLQTLAKSKAYVFLQLNIETHFKFTEWVSTKVNNVMILGGILGEVLRFQWRDIQEAIVRAAWRMSYFTHFVQQRAFVPPIFFRSGDTLMNAGWLMRCGWPVHFHRVEHSDRVLGRRRALAKQEAACRKRLLHCVPEGFKPRL